MSRAQQQFKPGDVPFDSAPPWVLQFRECNGTATLLQRMIQDDLLMKQVVEMLTGGFYTAPQRNPTWKRLTASVKDSCKGDLSMGQVNEWIAAFGRQGGTLALFDRTRNVADDMKLLVDVAKGEVIPTAHSELLHLLMTSVAKGVQKVGDDVYEFEDPGLSVMDLNSLHIVRQQKIIDNLDRWKDEKWITWCVQPRTYRIRIAQCFFNKGFPAQEKLLRGQNTEISKTRQVFAFLVVNALAGGDPVLPEDRFLRTIELWRKGRRFAVGRRRESGLIDVICDYEEERYEGQGLGLTLNN